MTEAWPATADSDVSMTDRYIDKLDVCIEIDVDNILTVIRRHLIDPPPIRDKALEDE